MTAFARLTCRLAGLALAGLVAACGSGDRAPPAVHLDRAALAETPRTIAVLPFRNLTGNAYAGDVAQALVEPQIRARGLFQPLEESDMAARLTAQGLDPLRAAETMPAAELGRRLQVDAVLTGSVAEYGYTYSLREEPAVALAMRLVRSSDGKVLWSDADADRSTGMTAQDSLGQTALQLVDRMLARLHAGTR